MSAGESSIPRCEPSFNTLKHALQERVASWVLKEWGSSPVVPTQALLSFLKAELDAVAPPASPLQPPLAMLPPQPGMSEEVGSDSDDDMMRGSPSGRRQQQQPQLMQQHVQPPQLFPMPMQPPR